MSYGTLSLRWTVTMIDPELGANFDLKKDDILEFTGDGIGGTGTVKRYRDGETTIVWGVNCSYVATPVPKVSGDHKASENGGKFEDEFELVLPVMHKGNITRKGGGTGGHGTWTAEEGG